MSREGQKEAPRVGLVIQATADFIKKDEYLSIPERPGS